MTLSSSSGKSKFSAVRIDTPESLRCACNLHGLTFEIAIRDKPPAKGQPQSCRRLTIRICHSRVLAQDEVMNRKLNLHRNVNFIMSTLLFLKRNMLLSYCMKFIGCSLYLTAAQQHTFLVLLQIINTSEHFNTIVI
jgi:hypothetical protein